MIITMDILLTRIDGLCKTDVERWIVNAWVRPDGHEGDWAFHEIDVARIRLIRELRDELAVNEDALPVVLSLLDQLHDTRRELRRLLVHLESPSPGEAGA
jgi:chaperone modulatory protein CbpM